MELPTNIEPKKLLLIVGGGVAAGLLWRKFSGRSSVPSAQDQAMEDYYDTGAPTLGNLGAYGQYSNDRRDTVSTPVVSGGTRLEGVDETDWKWDPTGQEFVWVGTGTPTPTPADPEPYDPGHWEDIGPGFISTIYSVVSQASQYGMTEDEFVTALRNAGYTVWRHTRTGERKVSNREP